jgi:hypothetical protein
MLWIENIVESTLTLPFLTNSKVGIASFVDPHKVVARSAILAFPSAWNEVESKGGTESEKLKYQFSQVEWDLDLQEIPKLILIPNKKTPKKKKRWSWWKTKIKK